MAGQTDTHHISMQIIFIGVLQMTVAVFVPDDHTLKQLPTGIRAADALGHLQSLYGLPSHLGRLRHADGRPVSNDEELNSTTKGYIYSFMINSGRFGFN